MDRLEFENYEELAEEISDGYDFIDDIYGEVTVIAKYDDAKEIIRELLCIGYDIASIDLHREEFEDYYDEYILSLNHDGIWCEKFKRDYGYFEDESNIIYIMDSCSSAVIPYCKSENVYEVSICECNDDELEEDSEPEHEYIVNREVVDKATFNDYVSQFAPDLVNEEDNDSDDEDNVSDDNTDSSSITVKSNVDTDEVEKIFKDMEKNIRRMDNMFDILYRPYLYDYRP